MKPYENLPIDLKDTPQWILWRYGVRDGKVTKIPTSVKDGQSNIDAHNSQNWTDYKHAKRQSKVYGTDGVGFVLTADDPFVGIDLDHCIHEDGTLEDWAEAILARVPSYWEITPSGTGLRAFAKGTLPEGGRKRGQIEFYEQKRFLTVTGLHFGETPAEAVPLEAELHTLHAELFAKPEARRVVEVNRDHALPEDDLLEKAFSASNGNDIESLYRGDTSLHDGDASVCDMALCAHLAFYAGSGGQDCVDRLYRGSGLYRRKWDTKHSSDGRTYGQMTIDAVYLGMSEFYTPSEGIEVYDLQAVRDAKSTVSADTFKVSTGEMGENRDQNQSVNTVNAFVQKEKIDTYWEKITPIRDDALPAFPLDALPPVLRDYAQNVSKCIQVPIDLTAMAGLAMLSFATSRVWDVQVLPSYIEPTNLYVAVAMEPGSRKTAALNAMSAPLIEVEKHLVHLDGSDLNRRKETILASEQRLQRLRNELSKLDDAGLREIKMQEITKTADEIAEIPPAPRLLVEDATSEKLISLMVEQSGTLAMVSSEGGIFGTMGGRYSGESNLDIYLKGHDAEDYRYDRKNSPPVFIPACRLTMCLAVQPNVLQSLTAKPEFNGRGMLGRFLYAIPSDNRGTRFMDRQSPGIDTALRLAYTDALKKLLLTSPPSTENPYERFTVKFAASAQDTHCELANEVEKSQGFTGDLRPIANWASKLAGRVARIACCLHCLEHTDGKPQETRISRETLLSAWQIGDYLINHAQRAFDMMSETDTARNAYAVLDWIRKDKTEEFSQRDCVRALQRRVPSAKDVDTGLKRLALNHYIRLIEHKNARGVRVQRWEVNPEIWVEKPDIF